MMAARARSEGMDLADLLAGLADVGPAQNPSVRGLALDSRELEPGALFLAVAGTHRHGIEFAAEAEARGAAAVAWEPVGDIDEAHPALRERDLPVVAVPRLGRWVSEIAARFYGHPSRELFVAGVTGTDGKTSVASFIAQALNAEDAPCGLLGTLGYGLYGRLAAGVHTTPDAVRLQRELAALRAAGATAVAMEVSSHALAQHRADAVAFDVAVLTNLSRDHLDYHGSLDAYAAAKQRLFRMPGLRHAVLNLDDALGQRLFEAADMTAEPLVYGLEPRALPASVRQLWATEVQATVDGLRLEIDGSWGRGRLETRLLGRFNAGNLLAAASVLLVRGLAFEEVLARLGRLQTVPGRMEPFGGGRRPLVVVDYAHTPRALEQALLALRPHTQGRLWCLFGAGGERDRGKRPLMGEIAERLADHVVISDDNPRHEDATAIVMDILGGMRRPDAAYVERDRARAIARAIAAARAGDLVLVAGKGHEDYQLVGDRRLHFSDREQVRRCLGEDDHAAS